MVTLNVSKNKENYSQRNNEVNPLISCNTTAMIMAISYIPELYKKMQESRIYQFYSKKFKQEGDCLQKFILDNGGEPTVHKDLQDFTNHFLGGNYVSFSTNLTIKDLIKELKNNKPVVISGTFPGYPTKRKEPLGHIVTLVGMRWNKDKDYESMKNPDSVIIDDPYGNTLNDWKGSGNDIELTFKQFNSWIKSTNDENKKWGHRFIL